MRTALVQCTFRMANVAPFERSLQSARDALLMSLLKPYGQDHSAMQEGTMPPALNNLVRII